MKKCDPKLPEYSNNFKPIKYDYINLLTTS